MSVITKLRRTIRRTRTLNLGPVTLVIAGRKRPRRPTIVQRMYMRNVQKQGLTYSEYNLLLTHELRGKAGRHATSIRQAYRHGVSVPDLAHLIQHGYL